MDYKALAQKNEELKKQLDILTKQKVELESLIDETGEAFIIGNRKGQIIKWNKKATTLLKYSKEELQLKNISEILTNQHVPMSFSRKNPDEPSNEFSSEQILIKKGGKKLFVSTLTTLLSDGRYQIILRNIDARKKAELALIDSEQRFRLLTENMHDVVWTTDNKLKTVYISASIINLTGFTPEEYYKKPLNELVTPISYRVILDTFRKESERRKGSFKPTNKYFISLEVKLFHKKNGSTWVDLKATVLINQFGEPVGLQGIIHSIEEKKQSLELFNKHKARYNFAIKSTRSGIWELDGNLLKIKLDKNLYHLLGYEENEFKPILSDWIKTIYKEDRIFVVDILQDILDGNYTHKTYECRRIHKKGYILWFEETAKAVIDKQGKVSEIIGNSKDRTREKNIEDKKYRYYAGLQLMIDSALQFLHLKSFKDICNYVGETLIKLIPESVILISSIDEEKNTAKAEYIYGASLPKLLGEFKQIGWDPFQNEVPITKNIFNITKSGVLTDYKGGFEAFFPEVSEQVVDKTVSKYFRFKKVYIIGVVTEQKVFGSIVILLKENTKIISRDFVDAFIYLASININKKFIEQELSIKKEKLQESESNLKNLIATKDKFFSIISHDLKNPFNTIIGFSGILMNKADTIEKDKLLEFSKLIHDAAASSYEMMQNLFHWAKSQRGKLSPVFAKFNLNDTVNSNIKLFSSQAIKKDIAINYQEKNLVINSDINIIDTLIRNLLSNALKFTNRSGQIDIKVYKKQGFVQIEIADNGVGIKKVNRLNIFRVEASKTTYGTEQERGSGLGLILCKELIDLLGGKIWFESEENKGTTFIFSIPIK